MEKLIPKGIENILTLPPMQEGMLFHYLKDPRSDLYFEQLSLEISGSIDVDILEKAWNIVIRANEMLRTVFRWEKFEKPSQVVLKEHSCEMRFHDFSDMGCDQKKTALAEIKTKDREEGFDLTRVPFRVTLCKLSETQYEMVISNHHILYDGWSNGIILKEFFNAYHTLSKGKGQQALPLPALNTKPSFKEYIKWLQSRDRKKQEHYWREYLAGFETAAELPIKRKKEEPTGAGDYSIILGEDIQNKLDIFIKNNKVTLASVFYSAWGILLQRYCSSEDILFGTTVSGRSANLKGIEDMVGLFINTIPLRINTYPGEKIINVIYEIDHVLHEREEFEHTPLVDMGYRDVISGRDVARNVSTLFDTIVVIENYPLDNHLVPEDSLLSVHAYSMVETIPYDLTVGIMPFKGIEIKFSFKQELFENDAIENLAGHFKTIFQTIIEQPETVLSQLEIISIEEKNRILHEFNNTAAEYPRDKTIHQLFTEQATKTPDYIAVFGHGLTKEEEKKRRRGEEKNVGADPRVCPVNLTYHELNEQSGHLAGLLIDKGVLPDNIVGIMAERSVEMIVGILGILKAGGAYLPIDPQYPQERIDYMLTDSNARILINKSEARISKYETNPNDQNTNGQNKSRNFEIPFVLNLDHLNFEFVSYFDIRASNLIPSTLAYIIYTSGSTGRPKGVMVRHEKLIGYIHSFQEVFKIKETDVILQQASISFDAFAEEVYPCLLAGGSLAIPPHDVVLDTLLLVDFIALQKISIIDCSPLLLNELNRFAREGKSNPLKTIHTFISGGDVLKGEYVDNLLKNAIVYNTYGPTETTVCATYFRVTGTVSPTIPIGKPISNYQVYIINGYGHLSPVGVPGEILIGGIGITAGYLNHPDLTTEKFIDFHHSAFDLPRIHHSKLYRTGDLARWLKNGNIEFLGRIDHQVKIRGFRIELGEIEERLLKHDAVKDVLVVAGQDSNGEKYLCAYIVPREPGKEDTLLWREYLQETLPWYMLPAYFVPLEKIPMTTAGKIDRKALPQPGPKTIGEYSAPRNEIDKKLVDIWSEVLGIDQQRIGINGNFFEFGGHSLKATALAALIHKKLNVRIPLQEILKRPTPQLQSEYIRWTAKDQFTAIEPVEKKEFYPLSSAQKRMYILHKLSKENINYNMSAALILEGKLEIPRLEETFRQLIWRHESLRTAFQVINDEPIQRVYDQVSFKIETGLMGLPEEVIKNFIRPFDLFQAPLLRIGLLNIAGAREKYILLVDMHHIIADGVSIEIFTRDFMSLYNGEAVTFLRVQYKDFSGWQNSQKQEESLKHQENFWKKKFEGEIPVLELPFDYQRPTVQSFAGSSNHFEIDSAITGVLQRLALETNATLYMILLAVYTIFLAKITNQEDIIVGSPIAGRRHTDLEKIIGMFVNTLAMRNFPLGEKTFTGFLHEVKEKTLSAFENQDYPFEDLVEQIVTNRDTSRNPVFDVMLVLQNMGMTEIELPGLILKPYNYENKTAKFDLNLTGLEKNGQLIFSLEYCTKLFKEETAQRLSGYFKNLINAVIENPAARIFTLEIMSKVEKEKILEISNGMAESADFSETIHGMLEKIVPENENKTALVLRDGRMTYGELNRRANRLARLLRNNGVGRDNVVGLMVERSFELVIGMVGIMKAGGAYLPIDPNYPRERIDYMLKDSNARILIIKSEIRNPKLETNPNETNSNDQNKNQHFGAPSVLNLEHFNFLKGCPRRGFSDFDIRASNFLPSSLVYVIYTSGSTGRPKGVMLEHSNLVNLIKFHHKYTGIDCSKVMQFATISFDASFHEIFSALLAGGELYLIDEEIRNNITLLLKYIAKNKIKTLFLPMAFLKIIFNDDDYLSVFPKSVEHIQSGGEQVVVSEKFKNYLKENSIYLHNHYGPSETHAITAFIMNPQEDIPEFPSIGKPVMNTSIYILDKAKQLLPIGVAGELYAGGLHVGRGYMNNPELTADRFTRGIFEKAPAGTDPTKLLLNDYSSFTTHHSPIYRTGDLCKWQPDGNIEFLGRIDLQVKIRGIRVETGEIESQLKKIELIKDAIVVVRQDTKGEKYLCAYIVLNTGIVCNDSEFRNILSVNLPDYMIPAYFVQMEKMPLSPSGKIDRKALPGPELKSGESYIAPRNEVEKKLVEIWSGVLGQRALHASQLPTSIGINDNFFQLGGNSLKAIILVSKIHKVLEVKIPLTEIFKHPRIGELAEYIKNAGQWKQAAPYQYISMEPAEEREYYALSSAQKRLYVIQQIDPGSTVYNMSAAMIMLGELDRVNFEGSFKKIIQRHESLRTSFHILDEEPVQRIHDNVNFEIKYYGIETGSQVPVIPLDEIIKNFVRPFDLETVPLLRVSLIKESAQKHILLIDMNHIISDGTSIEILANEFMALIGGKDQGPLPLQYRDWAHWQNQEKNSERVKKQEAFWLKEFEGKMPALNLPYDYTRPAVQDFTGKRVTFALSNGDTESLNKLARLEKVTLYMLLLSAYYVLLYKLTDREDIIIGAPTAGRFHEELRKIIGMFLNTLALRNFPKGDKPFKQFLQEVKAKVLEAFENQEYQFDDLVDRLGVKREGGRNPLFDVMFILQNLDKLEIRIPGLELKPVELEHTTTKFDFSLYAEEAGQELLFNVTYREKLFTQATIAIIVDYFKAILTSVIKNPGQALTDINIITEERRTAMLAQLNGDLETEAAPLMGDGIFQTRLDQSLLRFKDNIAVAYGGSSVSYAELDRRSDVICRWILNKGIHGGAFMGMLLNHRLQLIVTLLGIIKTGSVIVPLYPGYPAERLEEMIRVTGLKYLFIDKDNARRFKQEPGIDPVEFIDPQRFNFALEDEGEDEKGIEAHKTVVYNPGDPLYIHFTSGSTGEPKAILGKNRGLLHFISWEIHALGINPGFHAAQLTIPGFDPFLRDIFAPLLAGGMVCIPAHEDIVHHPGQLAYFVEQRRISLIHCVTGLFRLLIASAPPANYFRNLKYILLAGEKTNPSDLVEWYGLFGERVQLLNCYGPTETTMSKAYYVIKPSDINRERIPVGQPLVGSRVVILDENRNLCAPLAPGEICIRTPFGSCGYFNAPGLNREKFIPNPFDNDPGDILYRSGDLGRVLADGNIDILGRTDRQVKIRGYRVEPGDIEHHLLKHPEIKDAVVLPLGNESKDNYLCAYIIPHRAFTISELRQYLAPKLPDYMIPAYFVQMERFPLTARGKIDHGALPEPGIEIEEDFIAPSNETEKRVLSIWSEVLGKEESKISVQANFFELGGHSLKATILRSKLHQSLNIDIPVSEFFKKPTIKKISDYIKQIKGLTINKYTDLDKVEKKEYYELSSAQKRLFILDKVELSINTAYNQPAVMLIEGGVDIQRLEDIFNTLLKRHDSLRTSFDIKQGKPVQIVHDTVAFEIKYPSPGNNPPKNETVYPGKTGDLNQTIKDFIKPFDLSKAPLLRAALTHLDNKKHLLLLDMHHIISDGVSMGILVRDFLNLYEGNILPGLRFQYKDFVDWQNKVFHSGEMKRQEEYWLNRFKGDIPVLDMPADYPRQSIKSFEGNTVIYEIDRQLIRKTRKVMTETGTTLYMVLLAICNILLSRYTGQDDIMVGCPTAGRNHADLENIIGMFVNTLVIRNYPKREKSFRDFLEEVKKNALNAFDNQDYPFDELVNKLEIPKDSSRNPLVDVLFVSEKLDTPKLELRNLTFAPFEFENRTAHMDLVFYIIEEDIDKVILRLEYASALFKLSSMERMLKHYSEILEQVINDINIQLKAIDISQDILTAQANILTENLDDFDF